MKSSLGGPIRELLTAAAALLAAANIFPETSIDTIAGVATAAVMVAVGILRNEGGERIFTLVRKLLSVLPAALVHFKVITPDLGAQVGVLAAPAVAMVWSYWFKGLPLPRLDHTNYLLALGLLVLATPSCTTSQRAAFGKFYDNPTVQAGIEFAGPILIKNAIVDNPEYDQVISGIADEYEGVEVDFTAYDSEFKEAAAILIGSALGDYLEESKGAQIARVIRAGLDRAQRERGGKK